jgi:hypothetical protein
MLLRLLTAFSMLPRHFRGFASLCLAVAILAPDALALLSLSSACGKKCCRTSSKSCCRHREPSPNNSALSASPCPAKCATRAVPNNPISLSPVTSQAVNFPPPAPPIFLTVPQATATPLLRTFQLFQRPPPAFVA